MYAFVIYDSVTDSYLAARDPIGIIPLYVGRGRDGSVWFSSEMKALQNHCETFEVKFICVSIIKDGYAALEFPSRARVQEQNPQDGTILYSDLDGDECYPNPQSMILWSSFMGGGGSN